VNNGIFATPNFSVATDLVGIKPLLGVPQAVPTPLHFPPVNDFRIGSSNSESSEDVVLVIDTVKGGTTTVLLYAPGSVGGGYSVNWGDGTTGGVIPIGTANIRRVGSYETRFETTSNCDLILSHTYVKHGIYRIVVKGVFGASVVTAPVMNIQAPLISIESFGREVNRVGTLTYTNSTNLVSVPPYLPTGLITSLNGSFFGCSNLTRGMTTWDTSRITNMNGTFQNCSNLNINGSWNWNTRNVTIMNYMFVGTTINNASFDGWTHNASTFSMFDAAVLNSCSLVNWSGNNALNMFQNATLNNCTLSGWRLTSVAYSMFNAGATTPASVTNLYMPSWDLRGVTNLNNMFYLVNGTKSGLDDWNVSGITNMAGMFQYASDYIVADLSNWDISKVTTFQNFMLRSATTPSGSITINNWNIPTGCNCTSMFSDLGENKYASLSGWNFQGGVNCNNMFGATNYANIGSNGIPGLDSWKTSGIANMTKMFWYSNWNVPIESWDVSNVTNMTEMFYTNRGFNRNLSGWNTGSVTGMAGMFKETNYYGNPSYRGSGINNWNVTGVRTVNNMFLNSVALSCNLSGWNLCNCTDMTSFMQGTNIGSGNYDILLNSWATTSTGNPIKPWTTGINVHFGTAKYTAASSGARAKLVNYGWTITDGGFQA
jgi:surface protein